MLLRDRSSSWASAPWPVFFFFVFIFCVVCFFVLVGLSFDKVQNPTLFSIQNPRPSSHQRVIQDFGELLPGAIVKVDAALAAPFGRGREEANEEGRGQGGRGRRSFRQRRRRRQRSEATGKRRRRRVPQRRHPGVSTTLDVLLFNTSAPGYANRTPFSPRGSADDAREKREERKKKVIVEFLSFLSQVIFFPGVVVVVFSLRDVE